MIVPEHFGKIYPPNSGQQYVYLLWFHLSYIYPGINRKDQMFFWSGAELD